MRSHSKVDLFGGPWMVALMIGPGLFMFGVFVLWPTLDAVIVSMHSWTGFSPESRFIGLRNYASLLEDGRFWQSLANTLYYVALGGVGHFAFAFLFASALNNPRFAAKKVYQTLIFFPAFISVVGVAILWSRLYSTTDGLLNEMLAAFGFGQGVEWLSDRNAMNSIIISSTWAGVGGQMILILAGMRRIPPTYYEAARIDGANEIHLFWHVTMPMLKDVTYVALSLWLIGSMQVTTRPAPKPGAAA